MPAEELGEIALEIFGPDRVDVRPRLIDAVDTAIALAEADAEELPSGVGVVVTGSVVTAGEARALFGKEPT
jgi:dihydrofolate synthase/folylpolyglutamate synthase